jgi:hypothetical protein
MRTSGRPRELLPVGAPRKASRNASSADSLSASNTSFVTVLIGPILLHVAAVQNDLNGWTSSPGL